MQVYTFEIKTVSEANQREHWRVRNARKKSQQADFAALWWRNGGQVEPPAMITFTRYSCRLLDNDNLAGAFKHVRDELARQIGIDDGDERVKYRYEQVRIPNRLHYFTVTVLE